MFYIVYSCYKPNTAPANRVLALVKGFDELGIEAELVLLYPSAGCDRVDETSYHHIKVRYLWDKHKNHNKLYKYICSFIDARLFVKSLGDEDKVLLFGSSEYAHIFTRSSKARVFQERTEHPLVNPLELSFMQKRYMRTISSFDGMFTISYGLKRAMEGYGAKNVHVVNMLVDPNRFAGIEKTTEEKYIAYCGTASNNKDGVDDLIRAFAIVAKRHSDLKLKIMGKAPTKDDESGNLKLVELLGIADKVEFAGVIPAVEMPQMLKNATIVALARPDSLQAQCGFPTKLGEYLLSENPVVVTKVGDIPLFLINKQTALLSRDRNPEEFAAKMNWALEHPDAAAEIGRRGATVALREFNYLTEAQKMVDVIFNKQK